jgi:hypothetical protein
MDGAHTISAVTLDQTQCALAAALSSVLIAVAKAIKAVVTSAGVLVCI